MLRRLTTCWHPLAIIRRGKGIAIDDLKRAQAPVRVNKGKDDSVLIIVFSGVQRPGPVVYEFSDTIKTLGYNRIFLVDKHRLWFHHGIDRERPDFPSLIAYLKREIAELRPDKVVCVGASAGGYAAIVAGHQLRADYVHAFSPQTILRTALAKFPSRPDTGLLLDLKTYAHFTLSRLRLLLSKRAKRELFDLAETLKEPNGKTTYFVHYCCGAQEDRHHAKHISGMADVICIGYPCYTHAAAIFLAKKGFLTEVLAMANQRRLVELAKEHFSDGLEINVPRPNAQTGCAE